MTSFQPAPPAPPGDMRIQIGTNGVTVLGQGDAETTAALTVQAQMLKARVASLTKEIEAVKAEMNAPGSAPLMPSNQLRLTGLEGRRADAEEALERVENQLAGVGAQPTFTEIGVPPELPGIPFDPNLSSAQEKIFIAALAAIVCIGMPIAIAVARLIWKRTTTRPESGANPDDARRLERVEQAVDTIAVEMERMSEGQRYVTKLLAERAERGGEPVAVPLARSADELGRR
ncbi:MAG: hypothetical protein HEQ38_00680 [Gemmatimonas sp.]|nr:hypothetical protein [Gemmatimonas sp.]